MPAARLRAQENKVEAQWQADRKLARQLANEERSEKKKVERAEAQARSPSKPSHQWAPHSPTAGLCRRGQDRVLARKLSKELNGTEEGTSSRNKLRQKLGALRGGLTEMTNKIAA